MANSYVYQQVCGASWQWKTCKCTVYCNSTAESELAAAHLAAELAIYARKTCDDFRITPLPIVCWGDNQAAIKICHRNHTSRKERCMRVRADHIKGVVEDELVVLRDIESAKNPSDLGTKPIVAIDLWRYLAAILHGKIRLGLPRSDFTSQQLRQLMETSNFHSPSRASRSALKQPLNPSVTPSGNPYHCNEKSCRASCARQSLSQRNTTEAFSFPGT